MVLERQPFLEFWLEKKPRIREYSNHALAIGYFAQEHETLDVAFLENMHHSSPQLADTDARKVLGSFCSLVTMLINQLGSYLVVRALDWLSQHWWFQEQTSCYSKNQQII